MPKKFLTAQSATFKVLPQDTGIAKAVDDPMGVKGLNPFHDLAAGFVKVDAEGQPYTVGVLPDTVSILGSDTILIAEDPSDTFTFSIPTTATPQLAGLGIGTPGVADTLTFGAGGGLITRDSGDLTLSTTVSGDLYLGPTGSILGSVSGALGSTVDFRIAGIPNTSATPIVGLGAAGDVNLQAGSGVSGAVGTEAPAILIQTTSGGNSSDALADGGNGGAIYFLLGQGGSGGAGGASGQQGVFTVDGASAVFTGSVSASSYTASGAPGIDTTITTGSLVGKTITITKGLITGFA